MCRVSKAQLRPSGVQRAGDKHAATTVCCDECGGKAELQPSEAEGTVAPQVLWAQRVPCNAAIKLRLAGPVLLIRGFGEVKRQKHLVKQAESN